MAGINQTLQEQLAAWKKKLDAKGWPRCKKCGREVSKLRDDGICSECTWKHRASPTPPAAKPSTQNDRKDIWDEEPPQ